MEVRKWLEPLLVQVLTAVQPETADDWYQCFSDISVSVYNNNIMDTLWL